MSGHPRAAAAGFTLLETLVALAILGIVLTAVYGVFGSGLRTAQRDEDRLLLALVARNLLARSALDLYPGTISNRRPFIMLDANDGTPDGLTVDEEGCLWVAVWDAWRVSRYAPDGRELMRIRMPVPRPTSCCFGGPNLDTLYVTSASVRSGTISEMLSMAAWRASIWDDASLP